MFNHQLQCRFCYLSEENQQHIFEECKPLRTDLVLKQGVKLVDIYGDIKKQKSAISTFLQIEERRIELVQKLELAATQVHRASLLHQEEDLPGGNNARTRAVQAPDFICV